MCASEPTSSATHSECGSNGGGEETQVIALHGARASRTPPGCSPPSAR
jgi:hypothetical protein